MNQETPNQGEVAILLKQIEDEYRASQNGLTGLAMGANHASITARMERLHTIRGSDAIRLIAERLEGISDQQHEENT